MKQIAGTALVVVIAALVPLTLGQQSKRPPAKDKQEHAVQHSETIVGLVDQTGNDFVIASEDGMRPIAKLEAVGFSNDNFARFVGARVRAKGELTRTDKGPVLRISSLDDVVKVRAEKK